MQTLIWSLPLLLFSAVVIGWGAEIAAVHLSAGIALAILAWLQTAPEFAVEAVIAWSRNSELVLANLTGSLRLLMGLGWPMIVFIHWYCSIGRAKKQNKPFKARAIILPPSLSVESGGLIISVLYFFTIWVKGTWTYIDGIILVGLYVVYFWLLNRQRKIGLESPMETEDDAKGIVHSILKKPKGAQLFWGGVFFVVGGAILVTTAHPFIESLKAVSHSLGVSEFVFIQWVAPIASEFPEKVTAFNWARKANRVPMAIMNMLSSIVCQWTLFAGMVPILFSISFGSRHDIVFTPFQETEILLTVIQSAVAVLLLADLKIYFYEAFGLLALWLYQFFIPTSREELIYIYLAWFAIELIRLLSNPKQCKAWIVIWKVLRLQKLDSKG